MFNFKIPLTPPAHSIQMSGFQVKSKIVSTTKAIRKVGAISVRANPTQKGNRGSEIRCFATCPATATATPSVKMDEVKTMSDLGIAERPRQVILNP